MKRHYSENTRKIVEWINVHKAFAWRRMCGEIGCDPGNFSRLLSSDDPKMLKPMGDQVELFLKNYGYTPSEAIAGDLAGSKSVAPSNGKSKKTGIIEQAVPFVEQISVTHYKLKAAMTKKPQKKNNLKSKIVPGKALVPVEDSKPLVKKIKVTAKENTPAVNAFLATRRQNKLK